ncbi:hypothetical protein TSUD_348560 [Trifolium subterraneum]|uniref:Uncharacterized protein n=1 Tax=Trifolium subterraneum TaxID=3900 RepID=A0A2Z6P4U0_TRISU|nr:hypothetical protein TSUD_348560 [Trifolium subterraneum]
MKERKELSTHELVGTIKHVSLTLCLVLKKEKGKKVEGEKVSGMIHFPPFGTLVQSKGKKLLGGSHI